MKTLSAKKLARKDKKNKKLAALITVAKLNDNDKQAKTLNSNIETPAGTKDTSRKRPWDGQNFKEQSIPTKNLKEDTDTSEHLLNKDATNVITTEKKISQELKQEFNAIQNERKIAPRFRLKATGNDASLETESDERVPLMLTDIQHLLLHSLLGEDSPYRPSRWYHLERQGRIEQTTCFVVEGVSLDHLKEFESAFSFINTKFQNKVEVLTPSQYDGSLVEELAAVPLTDIEKECLIKKYGSMTIAMESRKDLMLMMKAVFPVDKSCEEFLQCSNSETQDTNGEDRYPRTHLLLSAWQLVDENYPLPLKGKLGNAYKDYIMTKDTYKPVTATSPMYGLDCEMCLTSVGSEVTRVSLVNEKHKTVYESYVKPYNEIVNYLTQYSGIKKEMLENVETRLKDVQNDLRNLLPDDAILVGQSLNADLHALKLMHPYIIDTSVIFNITGERYRKSKLKVLVKEFLDEDIQTSKSGHCSIEDSIASLKLVQLKLSKSMEFGDAVFANNRKIIRKPIHKESQYVSTIFSHMIKKKKSSVIVVCEDMTADYHEYLTKANEFSNTLLLSTKGKPRKVKLLTVDNQEEVLNSVCDACSENHFTMAHVKVELDADNGEAKAQQLDNWINHVWSKLNACTLFVLLFSGTKSNNGVAMVKVKGCI